VTIVIKLSGSTCCCAWGYFWPQIIFLWWHCQ
jgi:hypothetical protein